MHPRRNLAPLRLAPVLAAAALLCPAPARADLALQRVMLSSAGVGYFEYAAEVDGPATLGLDVPLDEVDDVLKSLVVFDSAGGVGGVELPGRDGGHAAFGAVPFGPEALQSPVDLLNALQGVEIAVQGPRAISGRIIRAERTREGGGDGSATEGGRERTRVTLLGPEGLRQFVLEDADSVQVSDPALRARIEAALEAVRRDSGQDSRHLTLRATGLGHRTVRVGYVAVAPLWKASYRVVLPAREAEAPDKATARVQGWAVLENQSGADWNGVELALQYGNPVTFHQAIYRSYFVTRPEVPVEILGRLLPDIDTRATPGAVAKAETPAAAPMGGMAGAALPAPPMPAFAAPAFDAPALDARARAMRLPAPLPPMAAPAEEAAASEGTEETVFVLPTPVTLAAGHTAAVPILDRQMPATRLALAEPGHAHPLASVRLTNDADETGLSLPAGVLTLYDRHGDAPFAGDARLGGLPPGESRLLSFAEDLRTSTDWSAEDATAIASLTASGGVLHLQQRLRHTDRVAIAAPAAEARLVLLSIAKRDGFTLVREGLDLPVEETATAWRLTVEVAAGQTRRLDVRSDEVTREEVRLADDPSALAVVLNEQGLTPSARAALQKLAALRAEATARETARRALQGEMDAVERDEQRLRANLAAVPPTEALHMRLVHQLDGDEQRIGQLGQSIAEADAAVKQAQQTLREAITALQL
jgi:hypothetical protein